MQYYYVNPSSEKVGPVSIEQLQKAGLTAETLVWKEGMKEWIAAGTVPELQHLFAPVPPPVEKKPAPPPLPTQKTAAANLPAKQNRNRLIMGAAGVLVLIVIGAIMFFKKPSAQKDENKLGSMDSVVYAQKDTVAKKDTATSDTTRLVNMDSLANTLNWDTTASSTAQASGDSVPSFLPGFGSSASAPSKKNKKTTPANKTRKKPSEQQNDQRPSEQTETRRNEQPSVNPAKYLSVTGSFRKNLVFEAILEGTIRNSNNRQVRDVTIEVWFLDDSGQTIGNKRFTYNGPLAAGASSPFKFKTRPPKGAKGARYEIAAASLN